MSREIVVPKLTPEEVKRRVLAMGTWFETLGVRASEVRILGYCSATCDIPLDLFFLALDKAMADKEDEYQTAPGPGRVRSAAVQISRRDWWSENAGKPDVGYSDYRTPRWAIDGRYRQMMIERGKIAMLKGHGRKVIDWRHIE